MCRSRPARGSDAPPQGCASSARGKRPCGCCRPPALQTPVHVRHHQRWSMSASMETSLSSHAGIPLHQTLLHVCGSTMDTGLFFLHPHDLDSCLKLRGIQFRTSGLVRRVFIPVKSQAAAYDSEHQHVKEGISSCTPGSGSSSDPSSPLSSSYPPASSTHLAARSDP